MLFCRKKGVLNTLCFLPLVFVSSESVPKRSYVNASLGRNVRAWRYAAYSLLQFKVLSQKLVTNKHFTRRQFFFGLRFRRIGKFIVIRTCLSRVVYRIKSNNLKICKHFRNKAAGIALNQSGVCNNIVIRNISLIHYKVHYHCPNAFIRIVQLKKKKPLK